jgi:hypothetical protein
LSSDAFHDFTESSIQYHLACVIILVEFIIIRIVVIVVHTHAHGHVLLDLFIKCNILVDNIKELFILSTLVIARLARDLMQMTPMLSNAGGQQTSNRRIVEPKVIGGHSHVVFQNTGKNSIILFIFGNHEFTR